MGNRGATVITGGAGFVGSNLAEAYLSAGDEVVIVDNFSREGVRANVDWLRRRFGARLRVEETDVRDAGRISELVAGARRVFHLAAQVAVTTSVEDPRRDLETNLIGTFNILEAARRAAEPPAVLMTSTNKVYGALEGLAVEAGSAGYRYLDGRRGIDEAQPLDFHSPYGCSKGAADQYVRDYARIYGIRTVVFRLSCIYGRRQFGTEDQGWVAHFARSVLAGRPITIFGDGRQVRDVLWVGDLVEAMQESMRRIEDVRGQVFNIGGGPGNAVAVGRVIERLMEITGRQVPARMAGWRPGDQRVYVSDTTKAERLLGWRPSTAWEDGLTKLVAWLEESAFGGVVLPLRTPPRPAAPVVARVAP
jgi:CDP-paratose 2-epimerase